VTGHAPLLGGGSQKAFTPLRRREELDLPCGKHWRETNFGTGSKRANLLVL
jgi:hypothetical protein